jgi:hypothetical protein
MYTNLWFEPVEQGVCVDMFTGLVTAWLALQGMCVFLFGVIIAAGINISFFDLRALKKEVVRKRVVPSNSKSMPFSKTSSGTIIGIPMNNSPTKEGSVALVRIVREPKVNDDSDDEENHFGVSDSNLPDLEGHFSANVRPAAFTDLSFSSPTSSPARTMPFANTKPNYTFFTPMKKRQTEEEES